MESWVMMQLGERAEADGVVGSWGDGVIEVLGSGHTVNFLPSIINVAT